LRQLVAPNPMTPSNKEYNRFQRVLILIGWPGLS
jgi:hypothetical protein